MQFELLFGPKQPPSPAECWVRVGQRQVPLRLVRHRRARRYVLRLSADGSARVTIPRTGSITEGKRFAEANAHWLEKQLLRQAMRPVQPKAWGAGSEILFRGEPVPITVRSDTDLSADLICFGTETIRAPTTAADLRPPIETHLRNLAARELPVRVFELSALHGFPVRRVTVRNQRSRWGSCSRKGTVSLNWRLIQSPAYVRDYIILHELAHFKEMNHSRRFWREVARLCPEFAVAEGWLKKHSRLLH